MQRSKEQEGDMAKGKAKRGEKSVSSESCLFNFYMHQLLLVRLSIVILV